MKDWSYYALWAVLIGAVTLALLLLAGFGLAVAVRMLWEVWA